MISMMSLLICLYRIQFNSSRNRTKLELVTHWWSFLLHGQFPAKRQATGILGAVFAMQNRVDYKDDGDDENQAQQTNQSENRIGADPYDKERDTER